MPNEKAPQPIRTELFRFVSLRAPQLIEVERKAFGFVRHPSIEDSRFLRGLQKLPAAQRRDALVERAKEFEPLRSRDAVRDLAPELHDFAQKVYARRSGRRSLDELRVIERIEAPGRAVVLQLWDNVFHQLVERRSVVVHQACVQMLVAHHLVSTVRQPQFRERIRALEEDAYPRRTASGDAALAQWLKRLARARLLIPEVFSIRRQTGGRSRAAGRPGAADALHGVYQLGVGVFRRVEQEVCCYVPGEVSHIENVMAREYKERHTRSLTATEETTEETTEAEHEQSTDTSTAQRNEMQSAVATVLDQSNQIGFGANASFSATYGGTATVGANASFDYGTANATSVSESEALAQAQDVTQQALARVVQRTAVKRVSRMLREFEENNRHGFDNREGDQHVTGIYRWLDIVYVNRIVNYGMRQMVEFVIPDPARFYVRSLRNPPRPKADEPRAADRSERPQPPPTLESQGIVDADDITRDRAAELGRIFDTSLPDPPSLESITEGVSLQPKDDLSKARKPDPDGGKEEFNLPVPVRDGYTLTAANLKVRFDYHYQGTTEEGTLVLARLAGRQARFDKDHPIGRHPDNAASRRKPLTATLAANWTYDAELTGTLDLQIDVKNVHDFEVTGTLTLAASAFVEAQWRQACLGALEAAYGRLLDAYERELEQWRAAREQAADGESAEPEAPVFGGSREVNRAIEQREIKRLSIEMIAFPFGRAVGEDHMVLDRCKVPSVDQGPRWSEYASHAKFYEQAFEWEALSYSFYPYYWADRCDWADRFQLSAPSDPLFESFLQAGMARAIVPVRPGFEEAVNLYLETGQVWNGADMVVDTDDDLYVSITEELQEPESFIEETWQTRVPTTLTIVQGDSVFLEGEGLPCCTEVVEDASGNPLKSQPLRLKGRAG